MPSPRPRWCRDFPTRPGTYWMGWLGSDSMEVVEAVAGPAGAGLVLWRWGKPRPSRRGDLPPETRFMGPLPQPRVPGGGR